MSANDSPNKQGPDNQQAGQQLQSQPPDAHGKSGISEDVQRHWDSEATPSIPEMMVSHWVGAANVVKNAVLPAKGDAADEGRENAAADDDKKL